MGAVVAVTDVLPDITKNSGPVWYPITYFTDNDEDPVGEGLVLTIVSPAPVGCTAVIDALGTSVVVTPNYNHTGAISFNYRVTDTEDDNDEVSVTGTVTTEVVLPNVVLPNEANTEWLSKDNHKIVLIDVAYHDGETEKVKYFSSYPYIMTFNEVPYVNIIGETISNVGYNDVIIRTPILSSQMDSSTNAGLIELLNVNAEFDDLLNYAWEGHSIGIYLGEPSWARGRFLQIFEGVVETFTAPSSDSLAINIIDKAETLNVSMQDKFINTDDDYLGTLYDSSPTQPVFTGFTQGEYDGRTIPEGIENSPVPICLGKCFNVTPVNIDSSNHIYQIHDGPIEEITEVRANGNEVTDYEANLDIGCFKLATYEFDNPTITCDVIGQASRSALAQVLGLYPYAVTLHSVAYIVEWILLEKTAVVIGDLCTTTFPKTGINGFETTCGIYITEETSVADAIREIMDSISGYLRFSKPPSIVQLLRIVDPSDGEIASAELKQDQILERGLSLVNIEIPKKSINLGYAKNWTVQDPDGLAGVVVEDLLELYSKITKEYLNAISETSISNIDDLYPLLKESEVIGTLISDNISTDFWAQTEADRRMGLREVKRFIYRIEATATPFTIAVGDIIYITHPRYDFTDGKHALVIGLEEDPINKRVTLEVWL